MSQKPTANSIENKLVIGISSRALFNMDSSHRVFEEEGVEAYQKYQIDNENEILEPGAAFPLVKKLLGIKNPLTSERMVEVILLSRNSADSGLRIFNSIQHHTLPIERAVFTNGQCPYQYIDAFNTHLFLSAHPEDVKLALKEGLAAATIMPSRKLDANRGPVRIAFDGDSVLFSDESERVYQENDLALFHLNEAKNAKNPMNDGPLKGFLLALHQIQSQFQPEESPIRTALVTARSAPAHERVIHTLRAWGIRVDEALFLGGLPKGQFLKAFKADFFFDDQPGYCQSAAEHVATGHVPHGVVNEDATA